MLQNLPDWATDIVERLGYLGVGLLLAIANVFPPVPSEVVLGLAGYTASRGDAWVVGMIIATTVGSVVGALLLCGLSAAIGPVSLRAIIIRYGTWIGFGETDLDRAEEWFDRRSRSAVLRCRCVPLIRSLISIPAGFRRMPLVTFTIFTLVVALIVRKVGLTERTRAAEELAHPGLAHETLEEIIDELEAQAENDPEMRSAPPMRWHHASMVSACQISGSLGTA